MTLSPIGRAMCILLLFSLSSFAEQNTQPDKGDGGAQGGAQGGPGGGPGGNTSGGPGPVDEFGKGENFSPTLYGGPAQFGIRDVRPTSNGKCEVAGLGTNNWAGSPCEKIYGATPISLGGAAGGAGGGGAAGGVGNADYLPAEEIKAAP